MQPRQASVALSLHTSLVLPQQMHKIEIHSMAWQPSLVLFCLQSVIGSWPRCSKNSVCKRCCLSAQNYGDICECDCHRSRISDTGQCKATCWQFQGAMEDRIAGDCDLKPRSPSRKTGLAEEFRQIDCGEAKPPHPMIAIPWFWWTEVWAESVDSSCALIIPDLTGRAPMPSTQSLMIIPVTIRILWLTTRENKKCLKLAN